VAEKYFSRAHSAQVTFGKGPHDHGFVCDIVAHVMQGVVLKGSARATEAHPAFDAAAEKIERQLRRYTSRLKHRHGNGATEAPVLDAGYTVFEAGRSRRRCAGDHR
jgi:ribosomal subunit interface protein